MISVPSLRGPTPISSFHGFAKVMLVQVGGDGAVAASRAMQYGDNIYSEWGTSSRSETPVVVRRATEHKGKVNIMWVTR